MLARELKRLQQMIEADEGGSAREYRARTPQDGQRIGGGSQPDVPDDKIAGVRRQPFAKPELPDVERLGLRHGSDDRMERFTFGKRMHAVRAVGELNDFVSGG